MNSLQKLGIIFCMFLAFACSKGDSITPDQKPIAFRKTQTINYNNTNVNVVIDKPALNEVDVLIVFHGTIILDKDILDAASDILDKFKDVLDREDMMIVSVAYPGENLLLGDNIIHAEAALLWVKNKANQELGITVKKVFLAGHSQGGYLVTRLNTMHQTNGVIASAPGPLNLVYRCQLEEDGTAPPSGGTCSKIKNAYGTTTANPTAYMQRSLLSFTNGFKSDILFIQGLSDSPIQLYTWPTFKQDVLNCTTCQSSQFVEIVDGLHASIFTSSLAKTEFNNFINRK